MSDLFTRSRTVILREWRELEPKLAVGLLTGAVSGGLLEFASQNGIHLNATAQYAIVIGGYFLGGYIKSSSFPTIQEIQDDIPKAEAVAKKVIHPPLPNENTQPVKIVPAQVSPGVFTAAPAPTPAPTEDDKATQVLPSSGASFLNNRGI